MKVHSRPTAFILFPFLGGLLAAGSQIVLLREFLLFCGGNELTIGLFLACWLLFGGFGSAAGVWSVNWIRHREVPILLGVFAVLSLFLPAALWLLMELRRALDLLAGEAVVPVKAIAVMALVLFPVVAACGFGFALSYQVYSRERSAEIDDIGRTYLWNAIGSLAAGALISCLLLLSWGSLASLLALAMVTWALLGAFVFLNGPVRGNGLRLLAVVLPLVLIALGTGLVWRADLEARLRQRLCPGYQVASSRDSVSGNLALLTRQGNLSLLYNGAHWPSAADRAQAQGLVHATLLQHPAPRSVLLLGGGAAGFIPEILKHPVERLDVAELDPLLLRTCQREFPWGGPTNGRTVVRLAPVEARAFVSASASRYDAILVALPDPATIQISRLYTVEFLRQLRDHLKPGGIVAFGISGDDAFLTSPREAFLRAFYAGMDRVFANVRTIPGNGFIFLGGTSRAVPANDLAAMCLRLLDRQVRSEFINAAYLERKLDPARLRVFELQLGRAGPVALNTDMHPSLPWFCANPWRQKSALLARLLSFNTERRLAAGLMILLLAVAGGATYAWRRRTAALLPLVGINGFNGVALLALTLLSFQALFGLVYFACAPLIALFMLGLSIGAVRSLKRAAAESADTSPFVWSQVAIAAAFLVFPLLVRVGSGLLCDGAPAYGVMAGLMVMAIVAGALIGFQFLACCGLAHARGAVAAWEGDVFLYAANLVGGSIGGLLVTPVLVSLFGFFETAVFLALLSLGPALIARFTWKTE